METFQVLWKIKTLFPRDPHIFHHGHIKEYILYYFTTKYIYMHTYIYSYRNVISTSHFFFRSWVHRGQNLEERKEKLVVDLAKQIYWRFLIEQLDIPFPFGFCCQINTGEVKPLNGTLLRKAFFVKLLNWGKAKKQFKVNAREIRSYIRVVASDHFSVWHLVTQAVCGFVGIHGHV